MSCGTGIFSIVIAFLCHLVFEAPFASLIKMTVINKIKSQDEQKESNTGGNLVLVMKQPGHVSEASQFHSNGNSINS